MRFIIIGILHSIVLVESLFKLGNPRGFTTPLEDAFDVTKHEDLAKHYTSHIDVVLTQERVYIKLALSTST